MPSDPWERRDDENDDQWHGFVRFLELNRPRRLDHLSKLNGFKHQTLRAWSSRFDWYSRAAARDVDEDKAISAEITKLRLSVRSRQQSILDKTGELLEKTALRFLKQARDGLGPGSKVNPRDFTQLLRAWVQMQELIMGGPTDRVEVSKAGDLKSLPDEDLETLIQLADKAAAGDVAEN